MWKKKKENVFVRSITINKTDSFLSDDRLSLKNNYGFLKIFVIYTLGINIKNIVKYNIKDGFILRSVSMNILL